ncbi:MAG: hypothetical protein FWJ70_06720 [Micromonosporaceae bacterium]|jgi:hypothetical protein
MVGIATATMEESMVAIAWPVSSTASSAPPRLRDRFAVGTEARIGAAAAAPGAPPAAARRGRRRHRVRDHRAYATTERLLRLLAEVGSRRARPWPAGQTRPGRRDAAMVDAAREAIVAGDPAAAGLVPLARALGVSPYRLSRVSGRVLGSR